MLAAARRQSARIRQGAAKRPSCAGGQPGNVLKAPNSWSLRAGTHPLAQEMGYLVPNHFVVSTQITPHNPRLHPEPQTLT